ncbi:MAG: hypothetical protein EBT45_04280 [Alphaproteobacteria bacterium]|nr:hypothetical protein [Alphaproteobacteria bacterium]
MILEQLLEGILYRDAMMLVLNKPAGIAVHPGLGKKQNLQSFFEELKFGLPNPPALAHNFAEYIIKSLALEVQAKFIILLPRVKVIDLN